MCIFVSLFREFLRDFMQLLRLQYGKYNVNKRCIICDTERGWTFFTTCTFIIGTRRVRANEVYQEYIKDKNHYHMNATRVWQYCKLCVVCISFRVQCIHTFSEKVELIRAYQRHESYLTLLVLCVLIV